MGMTQFKKKSGIDIKGNARALRRLRTQCEKAKRILSSAHQAEVECETLAEGEDYTTNISRAKFEELCGFDFKKCMPPDEQVPGPRGRPRRWLHPYPQGPADALRLLQRQD